MLPERFTVFDGESVEHPLYSVSLIDNEQTVQFTKHSSVHSSESYQARIKLLGLLPIKTVTVDVITKQKVSLGGQTFGIKLYTEGVMVVGSGSFLYQGKNVNPAFEAGIRIGDRLMDADGKKISSNEELMELISHRDTPITFTVIRKNSKFKATVTPIIPDGESEYRLGLWVRDSGAGIGTITYFNHSTGNLAGLGHSVADIDTGELMPADKGSIVKAKVTDIEKGTEGKTGQLSGIFEEELYGSLITNTEQGVFAKGKNDIFTELPTIEIALRGQIKTGKAQIYTQIDKDAPCYYDIKIEKIYNNLQEAKNMVIHITDPKLLTATGGIVQGMSGSPIIQNGKLIGAVTHVFVDDPTRGYGIFIEKMLITENELN